MWPVFPTDEIVIHAHTGAWVPTYSNLNEELHGGRHFMDQ